MEQLKNRSGEEIVDEDINGQMKEKKYININ